MSSRTIASRIATLNDGNSHLCGVWTYFFSSIPFCALLCALTQRVDEDKWMMRLANHHCQDWISERQYSYAL